MDGSVPCRISKVTKMIQKKNIFISWKMTLLVILLCNSIWVSNSMAAAPVSIKLINNQYKLFRYDEPYFIKGAGGKLHYDRLAQYGGNSIRTWGTDNAQAILDEAERLGLTVTLGLWVGHQGHGFDYDNETAVAQQLERFRQDVLKYKDHPALLMWGVGNEVNMNYSNYKVWDAIESIAKMISEVDSGRHPIMTVIAGAEKQDIQLVLKKCPHIEVLGINSYAGLINVPTELSVGGWKKPFIVTEWGPNGYWEVASTTWGAAFEQNSTAKAETYLERYQTLISKTADNLLGTYVFLWGHKQEATPTWFGLFLEDGAETAAVDVMQFIWNGAWPTNRAPIVKDLTILNQSENKSDIHLTSNMDYQFKISLQFPEGSNLRLKWEILDGIAREIDDPLTKGDEVMQEQEKVIQFNAPEKKGPYRLYIYAVDEFNHAATMNLPFYID